jgi:two-component system sensor histidine kinase/response regulator
MFAAAPKESMPDRPSRSDGSSQRPPGAQEQRMTKERGQPERELKSTGWSAGKAGGRAAHEADRRSWAEQVAAAVEGGAASDVLYKTLLASVLDPTIAIDEYGVIITASASVENVFGWTAEELRGRNIKSLMPEPHHSHHDEYLSNYRRTGQTHILGRTREFDVVRKDGRRVTCELSVARAEMPDGLPPLFVGSFRDVTARRNAERALEESERRFRAIFDSSFQSMGLLDEHGVVLEVNQTALDLIHAERGDILGRRFWETAWWPDEVERERVRAALVEAAQGKFVRFETTHRNRDGGLMCIDFSLNPVRDAEGVVRLIIPEGRNIDELKRAQRTETAMLRALATIGESAAVLAHEIKNPITAVNVALRAVAKQLGEDDRAVLEDLVTRMQRLEAIMRRTLSFTRPLNLQRSAIDATELVEQVVRGLRPEIVRRGSNVRADIEPAELRFTGDRQLLDEALTNLIKNALESRSGPVKVLVSLRPTLGGGVHIRVEDDGPGIAESIAATLFKPFITTKSTGTGLGLAFCKKIVDEHGGDLQVVKSSTLGGACFEVRLPAVV